jgi:hypothetical protein
MLGPQALKGDIDLGAGIGSDGVAGMGALADGIGPPFAIAGFALLGLVFLALVAFATRR